MTEMEQILLKKLTDQTELSERLIEQIQQLAEQQTQLAERVSQLETLLEEFSG